MAAKKKHEARSDSCVCDEIALSKTLHAKLGAILESLDYIPIKTLRRRDKDRT